jgi:hypothetical protein
MNIAIGTVAEIFSLHFQACGSGLMMAFIAHAQVGEAI